MPTKSKAKRYRLVLAGNRQQAEKYAREMGWQPCDWRYLAGDAYARGFRDVELHKIGNWAERDDVAEILRALEPIARGGTIRVIEPNASDKRPVLPNRMAKAN